MIKKISAAVLFKLKNSLKILDLKIPKLKKGQVLVKIIYSGICKSQLFEISGGRNNSKWLPHLLGHEASGKVVNIGYGVRKVKKGDEVILSWIKSSGIDSEAPNYSHNKKLINSGKITTFSNYSIISENRLTKKPKDISLIDSTYLGCAFATGMGMVLNETNLKKTSKVVLIGLGGIGLGILLALKYKKINNIIIIDNDKNKKKLAKKFKIKNFYQNLNNLTKNSIYKKFNNGADICFESAGNVKTIEFGFKIISRSGRVHFASHPDRNSKISIDPHELIIGKKITGSWGGSVQPDRDFKRFSKILKKLKFNTKLINSKVYKLDNINLALKDFKSKKVFRPMLKMSH